MDQYQLYVDEEPVDPNDIDICTLLEFTAYDFSTSSFAGCVPEQTFPMVVESWTIQGVEYEGTAVSSFAQLEIYLNTVDPCGFWEWDGQFQFRGGMSILSYGDLILQSACTGQIETFNWNEFIIPLNPSILLDPLGEQMVRIDNLLYPGCEDSILVNVSCLGIINTSPEVIENDVPVDTIFVTAYENIMLDHCLEFEDAENHPVGIDYVQEYNIETSVFYEPGDDCFCYLGPEDYVGLDTLGISYCDAGDPILCGDLVVIVDVQPIPDGNTPPYTLDPLGLPEDTLFLFNGVNEILNFCLEFEDAENHEVFVSDWVDIGEGSNVDFPLNDGCIEYIPPAGFVGADVVLVN
ncbi:MAG: hypothetical protein AAF193_10630, partial [Bacteroidota bacterium]